jgi:hypothetical protein
LKQLPFGNREYALWKTRLEESIKAGLEEGDLTALEETGLPIFIVNNNTPAAARQNHYLDLLDAYDLNIEKIIQKHQSVKIENKPALPESQQPRIYISYGKESHALAQIVQFLTALDIEPLVIKSPEGQNRPVDDQVEYYLERSELVIILAAGDIVIDGRPNPAQNVIYEIGLTQKTHPGRIIYLLEKGTEIPVITRPQVWEYYDPQNLENVFLRIVAELRNHGLLKTVKPA